MNWIFLTVDDLRTVVLGDVIDTARALAATGQADPVTVVMADAVAAVRVAVAAGNTLDADPATVPGSLRALTARLAAFALLERIQVELTTDQRTTRAADAVSLERIRAERRRVEAADQPLPTGGGVETLAEGNAGHDRNTLRGI